MNYQARETAQNPAFALRETRDSTPNPYRRIVYSGEQADKFQILHIWHRTFDTLDEAIAWRDRQKEER